LIYFYEELIESLYALQQGKLPEENILGCLSPPYLAMVNELIGETITHEQLRLADSDYTGLVVHITLALERTERGFLLEPQPESEPGAEHDVIDSICEELTQRLGVSLSGADVQFLSVVLKGSKMQASNLLYYD